MNGKTEVGASIPARLETVGMENPDALIQALSAILTQRLETIDRRITEVAKDYNDMIGLQERLLDRTTDRLCLLERQLSEDENNYGRALALLEDRIRIIEGRADEEVVYTSGLNTRIIRLETDELNAIDERLCRLESPPALEIDPRATAKPSKPPAAVTIPIRVFECCACGTSTPCILSVDGPSVRPDHCPYTGHAVTWQVAEVPK